MICLVKLMPPKTLLLGITILTVVIIIGGVAYTLAQGSQGSSTNPSGNGQPSPVSGNSTEPQPQYPDSTTNDTTPGSPSYNNTNTSGNDSTLSPNLSAQEQIRDLGMAFLKSNKPETAPLVANLSWTGGMDPSAPEGTIRYLFYSTDNAWSVTVESSINSTSTYTVNGTYNSLTMYVSFAETYTSGTFKLTSYSSQKYSTTTPPNP